MRKWIFLALILVLPSCDEIADYINLKFKPVSIEEQSVLAMAGTSEALARLTSPNLAAGVDLKLLQELLASSGKLKKLGVANLELSSEAQILTVEFDFDAQFPVQHLDDASTEVPQEPAPADGIIAKLQPRVAGHLVVHSGLTVDPTAGTSIRLRLLPVFGGLTVNSVTVQGKYDVTLLGDALAIALNNYANTVLGLLAETDVLKVDFPTQYDGKIDPSLAFAISNKDADSQIKISGRKFTVDMKIDGLAWSISQNRVVLLARLIPKANVMTAPGRAPDTSSDDAIASAISTRLNDVLALPVPPAGAWLAVEKSLLAHETNEVFRQAEFCADVTSTIPKSTVSQKVEIPDETMFDCTPTMDCAPTMDCTPTMDCSISKSHDDRDCRACLVYRPEIKDFFGNVIVSGGCIEHGNDPFCEAGKKVQNDIYEADYAREKLACEAAKTTAKATCEAAKTAEKASCEAGKTALKTACEAGKEVIKRLSRTGNFANVDLTVGGQGAIKGCFRNLNLANDLSAITLDVVAQGGAKADVHLKFTPLDIVGHMACQVPWTDDQSFRATMPAQSIPVDVKMRYVPDPLNPRYEFDIPSIEVHGVIHPSPTNFLLGSTNGTLSCSGLNLLKPLVLAASTVIPELQGRIDVRTKATTFVANLRFPTAQILGSAIVPSYTETAKAILASGALLNPGP